VYCTNLNFSFSLHFHICNCNARKNMVSAVTDVVFNAYYITGTFMLQYTQECTDSLQMWHVTPCSLVYQAT
jgi:hypothetical protein